MNHEYDPEEERHRQYMEQLAEKRLEEEQQQTELLEEMRDALAPPTHTGGTSRSDLEKEEDDDVGSMLIFLFGLLLVSLLAGMGGCLAAFNQPYWTFTASWTAFKKFFQYAALGYLGIFGSFTFLLFLYKKYIKNSE